MIPTAYPLTWPAMDDPNLDAFKQACRRIYERNRDCPIDVCVASLFDELISAAGRYGFNHTPQVFPNGHSARVIMVDGRRAPSFVI